MAMRILRVRYRSSQELLANYQSGFLHGGLFYPTREAIPVGEPVIFEVRLAELADRILFRGLVAWRRQGRHRTKIRAGVGIEFSAAERHKRDFVLAFCRGELPRAITQRRHRRLPIALQVDWRVKENRDHFSSTIDDIGP